MHPYKYTYYFPLYCSFSYSSHLLKNNLKAKLILIGLCLLDATFPITQNKQITLIWWKCMDLPKWELTGKNRVVCILWELLAPDWHTHKRIAIDSFSFLAWDLYKVFRRYRQHPLRAAHQRETLMNKTKAGAREPAEKRRSRHCLTAGNQENLIKQTSPWLQQRVGWKDWSGGGRDLETSVLETRNFCSKCLKRETYH